MKNSDIRKNQVANLKRKILFLLIFLIFAVSLGFNSGLSQANQDLSTFIIEGADGAKLEIARPDRCHSPKSTQTYFSMRGIWEVSKGTIRLSCEEPPLIDLLSIAPAAKRAKSEYLIGKEYKLVDSTDKYKIYQFGWKGKNSYEVVTFVADDGKQVYVRYSISDPSNHLVFRLLDEKFELTYGVHHQSRNYLDMVENDKKIIEYARSISRRLK